MSYNSNTVLSLIELTYSEFVQTFPEYHLMEFLSTDNMFIPSCIEILNVVVTKSDRKETSATDNRIMSTSNSKSCRRS